MCHFAWRHGSWAQRAGTSGARAVRQLQRRPRLTSQHGAALFSPGEAGTAPALGPRWDMFPMRLMESGGAGGGAAPGDGGHTLYKRAGAAPGVGKAPGGQGDPRGGPRGCTTTKPPTPASLEPSKKLV